MPLYTKRSRKASFRKHLSPLKLAELNHVDSGSSVPRKGNNRCRPYGRKVPGVWEDSNDDRRKMHRTHVRNKDRERMRPNHLV